MMRALMRFWILVGMIAGVAPAWTWSALTGPALAQAAPPAGEIALQSYRLGVGDRLAVRVYGEDKLGGPMTVDPEGGITLPLAGRIVAEGKSIAELTEAIRAALADGYLRQPSVAVQVLSFRPWYILGEVNKPGQYEFTKGLTVLNAIAIAEGFTYRARKSAVFVTHRGQARELRMVVAPNLMVVPGDTIRVGERYF
jgi:protein involved in polysaccharide export with SLBB domain